LGFFLPFSVRFDAAKVGKVAWEMFVLAVVALLSLTCPGGDAGSLNAEFGLPEKSRRNVYWWRFGNGKMPQLLTGG
jgi:hypothetical protein